MNTMRGVYISLMLASALLAGCGAFIETPPKYGRFLDTDYAEVLADPGRVTDEWLKANVNDISHKPQSGPWLCGFVDFEKRTVWVSRWSACPAKKVRRHEDCHIKARESGAPDRCHDGRSFVAK